MKEKPSWIRRALGFETERQPPNPESAEPPARIEPLPGSEAAPPAPSPPAAVEVRPVRRKSS